MQRVKINEPVWSAPTGKESTRQDIRPKRRVYNERHERSDCYNCAWTKDGLCHATPTKCSVQYCAENYTNCQYWLERQANER